MLKCRPSMARANGRRFSSSLVSQARLRRERRWLQSGVFSPAVLASLLFASRLAFGGGICTPEGLSRYPSGWPLELDSGVYWFGPDDFEKAQKTKASRLYDKNKPTIVYFHGWTGADGGTLVKCERPTTKCDDSACPAQARGLDMLKAWVDKGWNVGFFYWDQFSDEDCTRDAEQKVWFDKDGKGLRWKSFDPATGAVKWNELHSEFISLQVLAADALKTAMPDYQGQHVRFVGHSIGAQLAVQTAVMLHVQGDSIAPQRLSLLEPFFTRHHLGFFRCQELDTDHGIGSFTAEATASAARKLTGDYKAMIDIYKSSMLTQSDAMGFPNEELASLGTVVIYLPRWCGIGDLSELPTAAQNVLQEIGKVPNLRCYHSSIIPTYFLHFGLPPSSLNPPPPPGSYAVPGSALYSCTTPSAGCTDLQLREWMQRQLVAGGQQKWLQSGGMDTFDLNDDSFQLIPNIDQAGHVIDQEMGADAARVFADTVKREEDPSLNFRVMKFDVKVPMPFWLPWAGAALGTVVGLALAVYACCRLSKKRVPKDGVDSSDYESGEEERSDFQGLGSTRSFAMEVRTPLKG